MQPGWGPADLHVVDRVVGHVQLDEMVRRAGICAPDGIEALGAPVSIPGRWFLMISPG
jgi:hypothetical protein